MLWAPLRGRAPLPVRAPLSGRRASDGSPEDDPARPLIEAIEAHTTALDRIGRNLNQITSAIHRGTVPEQAEAVLARVEQAAQSSYRSWTSFWPKAPTVVPDVSTGSSTRGLIRYLFGPGQRDEHTDPHIVAAWDMNGAPDPGRDPEATFPPLAKRLDHHVDLRTRELGTRPPRHVWHCPVRTAPGDRYLTDAEWAQVARRIMAAAGIAPEGDEKACRWIAVRHADDHIHILATTVRDPRDHRARRRPPPPHSPRRSACPGRMSRDRSRPRAAPPQARRPDRTPYTDRRRAGQGPAPGPDGHRAAVVARGGVHRRRDRTQR
ncbi:hypothetical protein GCM10027091_53930 [Streptomyces daliensis]